MGKTLNISDEERELLTPEELAGMEEGEEFDESSTEDVSGQASNEADASGEDEGEDDDQADDQDGKDAAADQDDDQPEDDEGKDDAPGRDDGADPDEQEEDTPVEAPRQRSPIIQAELPEDYDDKVADVARRKKELLDKYEEGDLSPSEYGTQLDDLNREERALERIKDRVELSMQMRKEQFMADVSEFLTRYPAYKPGSVLYTALDQEVRRLQAETGNAFDPAHLANAHKKIAAEFPERFGKAKADPQPARKPAKTVPTLANVPAANVDQPGDGEFDWLDRLQSTDPLKFEAELDKLSRTNPAKYDEYLAT